MSTLRFRTKNTNVSGIKHVQSNQVKEKHSNTLTANNSTAVITFWFRSQLVHCGGSVVLKSVFEGVSHYDDLRDHILRERTSIDAQRCKTSPLLQLQTCKKSSDKKTHNLDRSKFGWKCFASWRILVVQSVTLMIEENKFQASKSSKSLLFAVFHLHDRFGLMQLPRCLTPLE